MKTQQSLPAPKSTSSEMHPGFFSSQRKAFLETQRVIYNAAYEIGDAKNCIAHVFNRYCRRFPLSLPLDVDPSQEELDRVRDDEPDEPEEEVVTVLDEDDISTLPNEEQATILADRAARREAERLAKKKLNDNTKARIQRWLNYRYIKDHAAITKREAAQKDNPFSQLFLKLDGTPEKKPSKRSAINVWSRGHSKFIEDTARAQTLEGKGSLARGLAGIRAKLKKEMFDELEDEDKEHYEFLSKEEHEGMVGQWEEDQKASAPSTSPEARQRCIDHLPRVVQPLLDAICDATGWKASLMVGGPEPVCEGQLSMKMIHSGTTYGAGQMDFGRAEHERLPTIVYPMFVEFLKKCYSVKECQSRALVRKQDASSSNPVTSQQVSAALPPPPAQPSNVSATQPPPPMQPSIVAQDSRSPSPHLHQMSPSPPPHFFSVSPHPVSPTPHPNSRSPSPCPSQKASPLLSTSPRPISPATPGTALPHPSHFDSPFQLPAPSGTALPRPSPFDSPFQLPPPIFPSMPPAPSNEHAPAHSTNSPPPQAPVRPTAAQELLARHLAPLVAKTRSPQKRAAESSAGDHGGEPTVSPKKQKQITTTTSRVTRHTTTKAASTHLSTPSTRSRTTQSTTVSWFDECLLLFLKADTASESGGPGLGESWVEVVEAYSVFQRKHGFHDEKRLPKKGRPEFVNEWIRVGRTRSANWRPKGLVVKNIEVDFKAWWIGMQPDWRVENGVLFKERVEGNWDPLILPGINGMLSVMAALFFWGLEARDTKPRRIAWLEAVRDCIAVFKAASR